MKVDRWYGAFTYRDSETDLQVKIEERDGYWSWEVFDWYSVYATGRTPEGHGRKMAKEMAMDWIHDKNS